MTHSKALQLPAAVIALVFGLSPPDPDLTGEPLPVPYDHTLLAADQPQSNEHGQLRDGEAATP